MWPVRPAPRPGELLTSWMTRFGRANGLMGLHLLHALGLSPRQLGDMDMAPPSSLLTALAKASGFDGDELRALSLGPLRPCLTAAGEGTPEWILAYGTAGNVRRRYGLQVCPVCLLASQPYVRRHWRLAFVSACLQHRCVLIDSCPSCDAHLAPLRVPVDHDPFRTCFRCGGTLTVAPWVIPRPGAEHLQRLCLGVLELGHHQSHGPVSAPKFFDSLLNVVRRLRLKDGVLHLAPPNTVARLGGRVGVRVQGHLQYLAALPPWARDGLFDLVHQWNERDPHDDSVMTLSEGPQRPLAEPPNGMSAAERRRRGRAPVGR